MSSTSTGKNKNRLWKIVRCHSFLTVINLISRSFSEDKQLRNAKPKDKQRIDWCCHCRLKLWARDLAHLLHRWRMEMARLWQLYMDCSHGPQHLHQKRTQLVAEVSRITCELHCLYNSKQKPTVDIYLRAKLQIN